MLLMLAGAILAATVDTALLLLLPAALVTTAVYVNLVLLGLSVFSLFVTPASAPPRTSDASAIASVGPQYVAGGLLIACVAASLWAAIHGLPTVAYALDVLACGGFLCAHLMIRVSQNKIDAVTRNDRDRGLNLALVNRLFDLRDSLNDESLRQAIEKIVDKVRYGPSPARELSHGVDAELEALLAGFPSNENDLSFAHASVRKLDELVGRRARLLQDFRRRS